MGKGYSLRITNDSLRLPVLLANFVKPLLSNPAIRRENFENTVWQAYHVDTGFGNIAILPEWGYTSYEYPYGMMVTSEIRLNGNPTPAAVERWYRLLVHFLSNYETDFILGDVDAVRKSDMLYIQSDLYARYFESTFSSAGLVVSPIFELIDWDAVHYVGQTHQVIVSESQTTSSELLQTFLTPLGVAVASDKSIYSTADVTVVITSASYSTLDEFHHINSSFPIDPAYIIEMTPFTTAGYHHLLTCLNAILSLAGDLLFAWQGIPWVIKKYGAIYMNSDHKGWYTTYADHLTYRWKSATLLGHAPTAY